MSALPNHFSVAKVIQISGSEVYFYLWASKELLPAGGLCRQASDPFLERQSHYFAAVIPRTAKERSAVAPAASAETVQPLSHLTGPLTRLADYHPGRKSQTTYSRRRVPDDRFFP